MTPRPQNRPLRANTNVALLKTWMQQRGVFCTHEVIAWGLEHLYIRANRTKQALRNAGIIRELTDEEIAQRGLPTTKEAWYEWVGEPTLEQNGQLALF